MTNEPTSAASAHPGAMNPQDYRAGEPLPPTPECEPGVYCPFTDNGAYHGVCLWHEGPERTCTCDGRTAHSTRPPEPDTAATISHAAWATPYSLKERQRDGLPPRAVMHVGYPYGKQMRTVAVELDRTALLKIIANAADALRLLDEASDG